MLRRQLPVSSPVSLPALWRGFRSALANADTSKVVADELRQRLGGGARSIILCDSGTSALVLALRAAVPPGGTVAFPSYACVDLAAAARFADVRVRLYDLEPSTLGVDLESLDRTLARGVDAVLAVHLYGFPVDVPAMRRAADACGAVLIEDAAQAAAGRLEGRALGTFGDVSVFSFGRGKGMTSGRGGALVANDLHWAERIAPHVDHLVPGDTGWGVLASTAAQWVLGRPLLYGLPAAIPGLQLGEMVYHPAHEPALMSRVAAGLLAAAIREDPSELARRRHNARVLADAAAQARDLSAIRPIVGGDPGYLRFPVLDANARVPVPALGIGRGYPRALFEQAELAPCLVGGEPEPLGGRALRETLFTLPVHGQVRPRDLAGMTQWITGRSAR